MLSFQSSKFILALLSTVILIAKASNSFNDEDDVRFRQSIECSANQQCSTGQICVSNRCETLPSHQQPIFDFNLKEDQVFSDFSSRVDDAFDLPVPPSESLFNTEDDLQRRSLESYRDAAFIDDDFGESLFIPTLVSQAQTILSQCFSHDLSALKIKELRLLQERIPSHGWSRRLQESSGTLSDDIANGQGGGAIRDATPMGKECQEDTDCLNRFGRCERGRCRGFDPDLTDDRLIRCVDGYRCDVKQGDIPGVDIASDMQVIAISPSEKCGAVDPLKSTQSIFANSNRWQCDEGSTSSCTFAAGVGMRRNKTATVEGVRLCGCPNVDGDGNSKACDNRREFFVPLGRLSVQECIRNAHCIDHQFAYCVYDHCAGPSGVAASAGLKAFQCMISRNCDVQTMSGKALGEALKVLPVAAQFNCGAESALDPDIIDDASLPCVVDINDDGVCEINLGVAKALGTTRLCGCSGDKGGNGRACDQLEDFDTEMGLVNVGECIVDIDCGKKGDVCIDGRCIGDTLPPYVVRAVPGNNSYAIPPVNEITLIWNENIQYTKAGRKLVIASTDVNNPKKWEMEVRDPSTYKIAEAGYSITIRGREMKIIPDVSMSTFPEGKYVLGYEGGIVADLQDNFNRGAIDVVFTVSKTAGCPYLYVTGYSTNEVNPNGLFTPVEPINGHAAWRGGANEPLYIYWKEKEVERSQPGNWIISSKTDERHFIAYADLNMMSGLGKDAEVRPPSGAWKKWEGDQWIEHPDITMTCRDALDRSFPKLIEIYPKIGGTSVEINNTRVMMRFSKPVTYGHWANFVFFARDDNHNVTIIPDFESGMRGKNIKSDFQGVVELNLDGLGELLPGATYDLIGELGCLTDLSYNPWGPVDAGYLYFTTFGISCSDFPNLGPAYIAEGKGTKHGSAYAVGCSDGYTSPYIPPKKVDGDDLDDADDEGGDTTASTDESRVIRCIDGSWEDIQLVCSKDCPRYYELGPQYHVEGDTGLNHHGTKLNVSCAKETIVIEGTGSAETICNDGKWEPLPLKCGATCGPFPSLGASYDVQYDKSSSLSSTGSTVVGARRIVSCAPPALAVSGVEPEYVVCEEQGWSKMELQCHISCGDVPDYSKGFKLTGEGNDHGQQRDVTCSAGFKPMEGGPTSAKVTCNEGRWEQSQELMCMKDCGKFDGGSGYIVHSMGGTEGSHGSSIEVSCAEEAIQESGGQTETLTCQDGQWGLAQVVCNGPCERPEALLGRSYVSELQRNVERTTSGRYPHGTTGYLYCSASSDIVNGIPPEYVICNNGHWIPANGGEMVDPSRKKQNRPTLTCQRGCGPCTKDGTRYQDVGGVDVNSELAKRPAPSGATRKFECLKGYSPEPPNQLEGLLTCNDGRWLEGEALEDEEEQQPQEFTCLSVCTQPTIAELFEQGYELMDARRISALHGESFEIKCREGLDRRVATPKNETAGTVTCVNGRLKLPTFICAAPTCNDGIQNGDEEAIDCGGSCETSCTACQLGAKRCIPTCRDKVKNGDEDGVDCGGKRCDPCRFCDGPPSDFAEGIAMSIDGGLTRLTMAETLQMRFPISTRLDVFCDEKYEQVSPVPASRFQTFVCDGQPAHWSLSDGSRSLVLKCGLPRCSDGVQNGDEWGVDCGGSCPTACPTCNDGILNGDEESIDCGGSRCLACDNCGVGLFKSLNTDVVKVEVMSSSSSPPKELAELWDFTGTNHGNFRKVSCRDPTSSYTLLKCDNGDWASTEGVSSIYSLNCNGGSIDVSDTANLAGSQFQAFRIPELPTSSDCPSGALKLLTADPSNDSNCCQLVPQLQSFLSSECGALLYSSKSSQVAGFCTGTCFARLTTILGTYHKRQGSGCQILPYLEEMKDVFCATGVRPPSSGAVSGTSSSTDYRCFAAAGETLSQMKDLVELRGGVLTAACEPSSCFSSNLHYFELLRGMANLNQESSQLTARRNLRDVDPDEVGAVMAPSHADLSKLFTHVLHGFAVEVLGVDNDTVDTNHGMNQSTSAHSRRLSDVSGFLYASASSTSVRELLIENRYSRELLRFMCLTDGDGNSCGPVVQSIVTNDPSSPTSTVKSPTSKSCADTCVLEVTRHMGQSLYTVGKSEVDPYVATIGMLMRAYGRVACQKSTTGMTCGDLFSPNLIVSPSAGSYGGLTAADLDERKTKYPNCTCPLAYVGDGRCDIGCFNPDCNYDESDCLFETMFPTVRQRLDSILPSTSSCHPFSTEFECSSSRENQCRSKVTEVVEKDGCCAATRWEVLREALNLEVTMRTIAAARYETFTGRNAGEYFSQSSLNNKLVLDRSSSWIETRCQLTLDRSCSRGLRRSIVQLTLTLAHLNYQTIFSSPDSSMLSTLLTYHLRSTISDLLAVPIADVGEMRFWSGSVFVEVLIDGGATIPEILKDLKNLQATSAVEAQMNSATTAFLTDAVAAGISLSDLVTATKGRRRLQPGISSDQTDQLNQLLSDPDFVQDLTFELRTVQLPPLSTSNGPTQPPTTGTLDMPGYQNALTNPPCSNFLGLSPPPDFSASEASVYEIDQSYGRGTTHGSTRQVRCASGYEPSFVGSGPSPQFLVCDRGRWVTPTPGEKKLICRKPCAPYDKVDIGFDSNEMSITAEGDVLDGSTRTVSCLAGYHPVDGSQSPEVLTCQNGVWDRRSLACTRGDGSNQVLMNAVCGSVMLSDIMTPNDLYMLKQILSTSVDASSSNTYKAPTKLTLWSLRCSRGYVPKRGSEPVAAICVNDTLLATQEFEVIDWESSSPRGEASHETNAKDKHLDAKQREILHIYYSHQTGADDRIADYSTGGHFDLMECKADVRTPPKIASSQPGLPDSILYTIIFAAAFGFIALLMLAYYMKRTKFMKQPFFEHHDEEPEDNAESKDSTGDDHEKKAVDIYQTASGNNSGTSSPKSINREQHSDGLNDSSNDERSLYEQRYSNNIMMTNIKSGSRYRRGRSHDPRGSNRLLSSSASRYTASIASEDNRGQSRSQYERGRKKSGSHYGSDDGNVKDPQYEDEAYESSIQQTVDRNGRRDIRLSSLHREKHLQHQIATQHESTLIMNNHSPNPVAVDQRSLRIRGGHHRRAVSSHTMSSSIQWSNSEMESDYESSDQGSTSYNGSNNNIKLAVHAVGVHQDRLRRSLPHQLETAASALETDQDDDDEYDGSSSIQEEGSAIESGASFYSEVEVDPERLRDYHLKHPEMNRQMVDNLKLWSQSKDTVKSNDRQREMEKSRNRPSNQTREPQKSTEAAQPNPEVAASSSSSSSPPDAVGSTPNNTPVVVTVATLQDIHNV